MCKRTFKTGFDFLDTKPYVRFLPVIVWEKIDGQLGLIAPRFELYVSPTDYPHDELPIGNRNGGVHNQWMNLCKQL